MIRLSLTALLLMALAACGEPPTDAPMATLKPAFSSLAGRQVVFAHQSVGNNVLDGLRVLMANDGATLDVRETRSGSADEHGLLHFMVGENEKPEAKLDDFERIFSAGAFPAADIALLKLCYIDFKADTDGAALGARYVELLDRLQLQQPRTRFVAVTAPLTVTQTGPKAWVKKLLDREPGGVAENRQRSAFNGVIRDRYGGENRVFDLAAIEAHHAPEPQSLSPELASDGRHLNARGSQLVAHELVRFLAAQP